MAVMFLQLQLTDKGARAMSLDDEVENHTWALNIVDRKVREKQNSSNK